MNNNDIRNRFKAVNSKLTTKNDDAIIDLWEDQKRMRADDRRIANELQLDKSRKKTLKKAQMKHQQDRVKSLVLSKFSNVAGNVKGSINTPSKTRKNSEKRHRLALIIPVTAVFIVAGTILFFNNKSDDQTGLLGEATGTAAINDLPREDPEFELLYPSGTDTAEYDVVRISPPEAAPSYTYLDQMISSDAIFRVTQQEVPNNFDLNKLATDFQATSIIQIDDMQVYHGYSEKGGIQSLLFIKNEKLIFIRSPQKFNDDTWVSYIMSLN